MSHPKDAPDDIEDWHEQDWQIVSRALAEWAGDPEDIDATDADRVRAWELVTTIAEEYDVPEGERAQRYRDETTDRR